MKKRGTYIRIGRKLVPVNKKTYLMYYRSKRRQKYYEHDIKTETAVRDKTGAVIGYQPSKEDSLDRLVAAGEDFIDTTVDVEAEAISAVMKAKLREALKLLPETERELIDALFFSNGERGMTEQEYAAEIGKLQQTIHARKRVLLAKLKKILENGK